MGLHMGTIERQLLRDWPGCGGCREDALPDASSRPTRVTVVDGLGWTIFGRHIPPPTTRLQDMEDAADDASVIDARLAGLIVRQVRFKSRLGLI